MRILDYIFYAILCIVASVGLLTYNIHEDMYFMLPSFDITQKHEIYEKEQWEVNATNLLSVDIERIDSARYIISYLDRDMQHNTNLYGMLFYPNKYSITLQKGVWQNIATNTKVHSKATLLLNTGILKSKTKQYIQNINTALLQRDDSNLYMFLNATLTQKPLTARNYIFQTNLKDIASYIESNDKQPNKENIENNNTNMNIDSIFTLHSNPTLSIFAKLNAFLSHKPISFISNHSATQGTILPFYTHLKENIAFFGIFNKQLKLQEILKPHNDNLYTNPLITPIHTNYDLNTKTNDTTTHSCLALYQKLPTSDSRTNLAYQLCKVSNGTLQFEELRESSLITGNAISVGVFGRYVIIVYTNNTNTTLNLAVWNGVDFIPLKEIDKIMKGQIISPHIITHGAYAYIIYGKNMQNRINVITLNEIYIANLIAAQNSSS